MLPSCSDAERAQEYFERALTALRDTVLGAELQDLLLPIPIRVEPESPVYRLGRAVLREMPTLYLPLRYRYVSVEEALEGAKKIAEGLASHAPHGIFDAERLLFYAAWRLLHSRAGVARAPSWFHKGGTPNFAKLYDGPWIHSTIDPDQPASLKLGQDPDTLDYDEETKAVLDKIVGPQWSSKEMRKVFKPKEALGPVDVLKRLLYYAVSGGDIPSVQVTALRWHHERGWTKECPPEVERKIHEIIEGGDAEEVFGFAPAPDKALELCEAVDNETPPLSFTYVIVRADGDYVGRLARGCVRGLQTGGGDVVAETLNAVLPKAAEGDSAQWERDRDLVLAAFRAAQMLRGEECADAARDFPDVFFVIPSPAYYAAFSASLMITALKDVKTVIKHSGDVVFAGGDDLLAFAARPAALPIVRETREAYHGDGGFHRLKDYAIPAPAAYGRSYSLRLAHSITDFMAVEVGKAHETLEEAKDSVRGKDALAISTSTGHAGVTKTADADAVEEIVRALLRGDLSRNLPYDMERVYTPSGGAGEDTRRKTEEALLPYIAKKNLKNDQPLHALAELHRDMWNYLKDKSPWQNMAELLKAVREFL